MIAAEVNHGRWIVRCPACPSAASLNGPGWDGKTFHCTECDQGSGPTVCPEDRAGIEAALARRPIANQNWTPGETAAELEAENVERGV